MIKHYFNKYVFRISVVIILAGILGVMAGSLRVGATENRVPAKTDGIDEIVVVGTDSFIYAYDYQGRQVYKSPEGGWNHVATADLNKDGDKEIIAVGANTVRVYDPQVIGTPFNFSATYTNNIGQFTQVGTGNLIRDDSNPEIALLRSVGAEGYIVIYDPPNTSPRVNQKFLTDWRNFAIGDYDGDGDDDFALIYWNPNGPSGFKNLLELRKGHDPSERLEGSADNYQTSDSEWFDIAKGNFLTDNGNRVEWVGSQNLGDNIIAQEWKDKKIQRIWGRSTAFNFVATADFRGEKVDQVVMLRNVSGNNVSLRFLNHQGIGWAEVKNLGTGWLNLAAGNVDAETTYREAVILRNNLIRVYLRAQSIAADMDCSNENECLEITGSFNGALALGDLGIEYQPLTPFEVSPTNISRSAAQEQEILPAPFHIYGDKAFQVPLDWNATVLPYELTGEFLQALEAEPNLSLTITSAGIRYEGRAVSGNIPSVPWVALSDYTGTTPATITVSFSSTNVGSPIYEQGAYRAIILVWQNDLLNDRFRGADVSIVVSKAKIYLPIVLRD
jgi:hypothetical protein